LSQGLCVDGVVKVVVVGNKYGGWVVEVELGRMVVVTSLAKGSKRTSTARLRLREVRLPVIGVII
jgi:hypothetical protein